MNVQYSILKSRIEGIDGYYNRADIVVILSPQIISKNNYLSLYRIYSFTYSLFRLTLLF